MNEKLVVAVCALVMGVCVLAVVRLVADPATRPEELEPSQREGLAAPTFDFDAGLEQTTGSAPTSLQWTEHASRLRAVSTTSSPPHWTLFSDPRFDLTFWYPTGDVTLDLREDEPLGRWITIFLTAKSFGEPTSQIMVQSCVQQRTCRHESGVMVHLANKTNTIDLDGIPVHIEDSDFLHAKFVVGTAHYTVQQVTGSLASSDIESLMYALVRDILVEAK